MRIVTRDVPAGGACQRLSMRYMDGTHTGRTLVRIHDDER